jgi:hypothetical protein
VKENLLEQFKQRYEQQAIGLHKSQSTTKMSQPDIPLREPYGQDSFVKKQARVILAQERL